VTLRIKVSSTARSVADNRASSRLHCRPAFPCLAVKLGGRDQPIPVIVTVLRGVANPFQQGFGLVRGESLARSRRCRELSRLSRQAALQDVAGLRRTSSRSRNAARLVQDSGATPVNDSSLSGPATLLPFATKARISPARSSKLPPPIARKAASAPSGRPRAARWNRVREEIGPIRLIQAPTATSRAADHPRDHQAQRPRRPFRIGGRCVPGEIFSLFPK